MSKLLKILGGIIAVLVVVIVAAVVLIPLLVDPNDYRDRIAAEVKKATGRELTIGGEIGLSVFPWLGLELNALSLSNAPGFGDAPFAAVRHAQLRAKLLPLLSRELEVDTIRIDGVRLHLAKAKDGRTNWDDLATGGEKEAAATKADKGPQQGLAALAIGGVRITDAQVVWEDRASGQRFEISDFKLETGALSPGRPVDLELALSLAGDKPQITARTTLDGRVTMDPDAGTLRVEGLKLVVDARGEGLPPDGVRLDLAAGLALDIKGETLNLSGLSLELAGLALTGSLDGSRIRSDPRFKGQIALAEFDLRETLSRLGQPVPETADPEVLTRVSLSSAIAATPKQVALDGLRFQLDDSRLDGGFKLLIGAQPAYRFNLTVDAIDLDRYLPPTADKPAPAKAAAEPGELFPVETLKGLDAEGSFAIGTLKIRNIRAAAIELKLLAKGGLVRLDHKVGGFYQGGITGLVGIDVRGKTPRLDVEKHATGIKAGPLVKDLADADRFDGTGNFNAKLTGYGQSVEAIRRSLGGNLDLAFTDGTVKGVNIARLLREANAKLSGQTLPPDDGANQTDFSELSATATIANGVLTSNDLLGKSPLLRLTGEGKVDLGAETLDYTVTPTLVASLEGQGGAGLDRLKGVPIPVRLTGTLTEPKWNVELTKVLAESQKETIKQKVQEKIQEKLKLPGTGSGEGGGTTEEKVKGLLKGLF